MIRLLYGLTKEAIRAMRRTDLDDVARRLQSTAEDAAGQMGKKSQAEFNATSEAVEREIYQRKARNELAKEIDDDIVQATWETGGWIPGTKNPAQFVPEKDPVSLTRAYKGIFTRPSGGGGTALPEFTSSNLSKVLRKEGVDPNMDKIGWGGRLVSQASSPTKYKNIKFEDLNQAQQDVYKAIRDMKGWGDLPAKELGHPGVLADLLEEAGRAGDKIYRYQGNSQPAYAFISNYWRKKGPMIRKEWNTVQETGDFTTGTSFEEIIEGTKRID